MEEKREPNLTPSWVEFSKKIRNELSLSPENFLSQPTIHRTTCGNRCWRKQSLALKGDGMFREAYQNYKDPCFGGAEIKANGLSSPSIQQLYYLKLIKDRFGVFAPREVESVFEFGGGYGGLCRIFHHFGFQGDYRIYDIPVMLDMQRRYLGSTLINHPKVSFEDSLREWNPDLFIATFSLNESPLSLREEVREKIISKSKMVFIVFSNEFDGMDNISWSNKLKEFLSLSGFEVNVGNGLFERGPKLEISILYANKTK